MMPKSTNEHKARVCGLLLNEDHAGQQLAAASGAAASAPAASAPAALGPAASAPAAAGAAAVGPAASGPAAAGAAAAGPAAEEGAGAGEPKELYSRYAPELLAALAGSGVAEHLGRLLLVLLPAIDTCPAMAPQGAIVFGMPVMPSELATGFLKATFRLHRLAIEMQRSPRSIAPLLAAGDVGPFTAQLFALLTAGGSAAAVGAAGADQKATPLVDAEQALRSLLEAAALPLLDSWYRLTAHNMQQPPPARALAADAAAAALRFGSENAGPAPGPCETAEGKALACSTASTKAVSLIPPLVAKQILLRLAEMAAVVMEKDVVSMGALLASVMGVAAETPQQLQQHCPMWGFLTPAGAQAVATDAMGYAAPALCMHAVHGCFVDSAGRPVARTAAALEAAVARWWRLLERVLRLSDWTLGAAAAPDGAAASVAALAPEEWRAMLRGAGAKATEVVAEAGGADGGVSGLADDRAAAAGVCWDAVPWHKHLALVVGVAGEEHTHLSVGILSLSARLSRVTTDDSLGPLSNSAAGSSDSRGGSGGSRSVPKDADADVDAVEETWWQLVAKLRQNLCARRAAWAGAFPGGQVATQPLSEVRARLQLPRLCSNPACVVLKGDCEVELPLKACGGCGGAAAYCCRDCQVAHWRAGHKAACGKVTGNKDSALGQRK
eukprot:XP_001700753.1 predicted protein [Chlamydomonas reinhardtii]